MIRKLAAAGVLLALQSPALAEGHAVGLKAGALGLGVEYTYNLNDRVAFRAGLNGSELGFDDEESGIDYEFDFVWDSLSVGVDFHPFASAFAMTHGGSGVFGNFCLDEKGGPRVTHSNGHVQPFEDPLALYRLTGEKSWLEQAMAGADKYIAANITTLPTRDLGVMPFVNTSFVPDWEGLLHLYQASNEPRYLQAATEGARWLPAEPSEAAQPHPSGCDTTCACRDRHGQSSVPW